MVVCLPGYGTLDWISAGPDINSHFSVCCHTGHGCETAGAGDALSEIYYLHVVRVMVKKWEYLNCVLHLVWVDCEVLE